MEVQQLYLIEILVRDITFERDEDKPMNREYVNVVAKWNTYIDMTMNAAESVENDVKNNLAKNTLGFFAGKSCLFAGNPSKVMKTMQSEGLHLQVLTRSEENEEKSTVIGYGDMAWPSEIVKIAKASLECNSKLSPIEATDRVQLLSDTSGKNALGYLNIYICFHSYGLNIQVDFYVTSNRRESDIKARVIIMEPQRESSKVENWMPLFTAPHKERFSKIEPELKVFAELAGIALPEIPRFVEELTPDYIRESLCGKTVCPAAIKFKEFGLGPLADAPALGTVHAGSKIRPLGAYGLSQSYGNLDYYGAFGLLRPPPLQTCKGLQCPYMEVMEKYPLEHKEPEKKSEEKKVTPKISKQLCTKCKCISFKKYADRQIDAQSQHSQRRSRLMGGSEWVENVARTETTKQQLNKSSNGTKARLTGGSDWPETNKITKQHTDKSTHSKKDKLIVCSKVVKLENREYNKAIKKYQEKCTGNARVRLKGGADWRENRVCNNTTKQHTHKFTKNNRTKRRLSGGSDWGSPMPPSPACTTMGGGKSCSDANSPTRQRLLSIVADSSLSLSGVTDLYLARRSRHLSASMNNYCEFDGVALKPADLFDSTAMHDFSSSSSGKYNASGKYNTSGKYKSPSTSTPISSFNRFNSQSPREYYSPSQFDNQSRGRFDFPTGMSSVDGALYSLPVSSTSSPGRPSSSFANSLPGNIFNHLTDTPIPTELADIPSDWAAVNDTNNNGYNPSEECERDTCPMYVYETTCSECGGVSRSGVTCDNASDSPGGIPADSQLSLLAQNNNAPIPAEEAIDAPSPPPPPPPPPVEQKVLPDMTKKTSNKDGVEIDEEPPSTTKNHRRHEYNSHKSRFVYHAGEYYSGIRVGHKYCAGSTGKPVPWDMGWLWNIDAPGLKRRRGWKPGFLNKIINDRIIERRLELGIPNPPELKMLVRKTKVLRHRDEEYEPEEEIEPKPTLIVQKKKGVYIITMNPLKEPSTLADNENPYMECTPMQFVITRPKRDARAPADEGDIDGENRVCLCDEEGDTEGQNTQDLDELSSSSSELNIELTTPAGLIKPERMKRPPNQVYTESQFKEDDWNCSSCSIIVPKYQRPKKSVKLRAK